MELEVGLNFRRCEKFVVELEVGLNFRRCEKFVVGLEVDLNFRRCEKFVVGLEVDLNFRRCEKFAARPRSAEAAAGDRSTAFPFVLLAALRSEFCIGS